MADLGLTDQAPVSHLILTHAHLDHIGGTADPRLIAGEWICSGMAALVDRLS